METLAGLIRQPKYGHLKELHRAIKLCEPALISADPIVTSLGPYQQVCGLYPASSHEIFGAPSTAYLILLELTPFLGFQSHVFSSGTGGCAAFLSNYNPNSVARVMFNNMHYSLPPWSISILPDCRNVVFNTAKVSEAVCSSHTVFHQFSCSLVIWIWFTFIICADLWKPERHDLRIWILRMPVANNDKLLD